MPFGHVFWEWRSQIDCATGILATIYINPFWHQMSIHLPQVGIILFSSLPIIHFDILCKFILQFVGRMKRNSEDHMFMHYDICCHTFLSNSQFWQSISHQMLEILKSFLTMIITLQHPLGNHSSMLWENTKNQWRASLHISSYKLCQIFLRNDLT